MLWCRLFRREPSWKREASRAEVWLQETEAEEEVLGPSPELRSLQDDSVNAFLRASDFAGCDCRSFQAADLDDHAWNCAARLAGSQPQCRAGHVYFDSYECTKPFGHVGFHLSCAGEFWAECEATDPRSHEEVSPTVGDVTPPWGDANQMLDAVEAAIAEHQPRVEGGWVECQACDWSRTWSNYKTVNHVIAAHQARVVMDMVQAEHRIARRVNE